MDEQHFVTENIDMVIRAGLAVRDARGERVGNVKDYSSAAAYLVVQTGLLAHKELYVPFSAIRSIDPQEVYLNLELDVLVRRYVAPPPARTIVQGRTASLTVPGGDDGSPKVVNRVDLAKARRDLAVGMPVYDKAGDWVGMIDGIDDAAGYVVAKRYGLHREDFFIPFAAIAAVEGQIETALGPDYRRVVYLAITQEIVAKAYSRLPDGVVLHIDRPVAYEVGRHDECR